jgi:hypothetical protein
MQWAGKPSCQKQGKPLDKEIHFMKYRQKQVPVEAIQWTGQNKMEIVEWSNHAPFRYHGTELNVPTLETVFSAFPGDWLIKLFEGEFKVCRPAIFEMLYEPAEALFPGTTQAAE